MHQEDERQDMGTITIGSIQRQEIRKYRTRTGCEARKFRKSSYRRRPGYKDSTTQGVHMETSRRSQDKIMNISTPNLNFDDSGKNALYSVVDFKGP